jgi:hypothetical protein
MHWPKEFISQKLSLNKATRKPEDRWEEERLRQARQSFNLAVINSMLMTCFGIILLFSGHVTEGTMITVNNACVIHCLKLSKDTNDRLDEMVGRLSQSSRQR